MSDRALYVLADIGKVCGVFVFVICSFGAIGSLVDYIRAKEERHDHAEKP